MSRLWVINLDFESQLASGAHYQADLRALQWNRRYSWIAAALAEPGDALWLDPATSGAALPSLPESLRWPRLEERPAAALRGADLQLRPWGWSPAICEAFAVQAPIPCAQIAELQSKRWSAELAAELGCALPGCALLRSMPELESWLPDSDWVLKTEFGVAGRGALRRRGSRLDSRDRPWVQRALSRGPLIAQRWLERQADYGLAAELSGAGQLQIIGCFTNEVAGATWRAATVTVNEDRRVMPEDHEARLRQTALIIADRLSALGYAGPFGIDALLSREGALYPLLELNLRWTMGRVACELARKLNPKGILRLGRGAGELAPGELAIGSDHRIRLAADIEDLGLQCVP